MIISLRCKECKEGLLGNQYEYLFLCGNCKKIYILQDNRLNNIEGFILRGDYEADLLLPFMVFECQVDYLHFATKRQEETSIKCGTKPLIAVRAFSMIDPIYFGDIELDITHRLNNTNRDYLPFAPDKKNFTMDINPDVIKLLARYTFMKYFDRQSDITDMKFTFSIISSFLLFIRGKRENKRIYLYELEKDIPESAILSI